MSNGTLSNKEFFDYILLSKELNGNTRHYIKMLYDVDIDLARYLKDSVSDDYFGNYLDIIYLIVKNSKNKNDIKDRCDRLFNIKNTYKKYKVSLKLFKSFISRVSLILLLRDTITDDSYEKVMDKGKVLEVTSISDIKFKLGNIACKVSSYDDENISLEIGDKTYKNLGMIRIDRGKLYKYTNDILSKETKKEIIDNGDYELVITRGVY